MVYGQPKTHKIECFARYVASIRGSVDLETDSCYPAPMRKLRRQLEDRMAQLDSVAVAFSGGVDSGLVLALAELSLPGKVLALTADSPALPRAELEAACRLTELLGVPHEIVSTQETQEPDYRRNETSRCYFCKSTIYAAMGEQARSMGYPVLLDGTSGEDESDTLRPGLAAARELGVLSPLAEAGLDKMTVRRLARRLGLPVWDKPAFACLASPLPFGEMITDEKLSTIEAAENALRALGFRAFRVRHHGPVARIELPEQELVRALAPIVRSRLIAEIRAAGFPYVTIDLAGLRSGSMAEALAP